MFRSLHICRKDKAGNTSSKIIWNNTSNSTCNSTNDSISNNTTTTHKTAPATTSATAPETATVHPEKRDILILSLIIAGGAGCRRGDDPKDNEDDCEGHPDHNGCLRQGTGTAAVGLS
ncbi:hypothetical protein BsWGS_07104 [Bradybaena similaris]